ncbi:MAG: RagB/SusD family nutrient uptake outer membrane protein [Tannerellaceae bacterium]|nr:RagB/SusD family nutrient uptake outer membrane protein [Tannerellaceae bacterium]
MNRIIYKLTVCVCGFLLLSACSDDLDTTPKEEFSELAVWNDPALVETLINNVYFRLDEPLSAGRLKAVLVDEAHYRGNAGSRDFNNCLLTPDTYPGWSAACRYRTWNDMYKTIRTCNLFFENADQIPFGSALEDDVTEKDRMTGEMSFLRAYNYFNLVTMFGGVPIITQVYGLNEEYAMPRNTWEECINFIVSECDKAAALLPLKQTGKNDGRATKGAALSLKARVLLYAASDLYHATSQLYPDFSNPELLGYTGGDRTARWKAAKDAAKAVIDLGIYKLYKADPAPTDSIAQNLVDFFLSKDSEEDIFVKFFVPTMRQNYGLYTGSNGFHTWGSNAPIADMVDAYEMADGTTFDWNNPAHAAFPYRNREQRFYANVLYEGAYYRPRPADVVGLESDGIMQLGRWEVWDAATNSIQEVYGVDTRKSPIEDWNGSETGYYARKFMDPAVDAQYYKQEVTWRYIRYAEILLNYAEACIELGEDSEAKTYINMIRKRAGLPGLTEVGAALKERYRNERRIELTFEEHRFYDVRRWKIGNLVYKPASRAEIVYKLNPDKTTSVIPTITHVVWENRSWDDKAYFFPIMRDEMNKNPALIQNPGYK